jgi:Flp pilus assembly protein TadG
MAAVTLDTRRRRSLWLCERGAELVEFALVFPTLLLVLGGMIDLGLLFQRYEVVTNAAREGARVAALPNYQDSDVTARVVAYMNAAGLTCPLGCASVGAATNVAMGGQCARVRTVTVRYDAPLMILGPVFSLMGGGSSKTLHATAAMRMEMAAVDCS